MATKFRHVLDFSNQTLNQLFDRLSQQQQLLDAVRQSLPADVASHCIHCVVNDTQLLLLYTDTPAWATRLRFYSDDVLAAINELIRQPVTKLQIRIFDPQTLEKTPLKTSPKPTR